jgi:hypothetical protein
MLRFSLLFVLFVIAGCAETVEPDRSSGNNDLFPLAVGNEWKYARIKFVRGSEAERDTVTLRVTAQLTEDEFIVARSSQYTIDSLHVKRNGPVQFDIFTNTSSEPLINHSGTDPFAALLVATTDIIPNTRRYSTLSDTVYSSNAALRLREHVELMGNNGDVLLRLDFDHVFVEGLGQVAVRFVADINECLQCSLISEFWVYELVSYTVQ